MNKAQHERMIELKHKKSLDIGEKLELAHLKRVEKKYGKFTE